VLHEAILGGAVPVLLAGRTGDGLAGVGDVDGAVAGADQDDAGDDVEGLADGVVVPGGAGAGAKRTMLARMREGSWPAWMTSNQTSPVNQSSGPLPVGCGLTNSVACSLVCIGCLGQAVSGWARLVPRVREAAV
jgi:hypothetical protein